MFLYMYINILGSLQDNRQVLFSAFSFIWPTDFGELISHASSRRDSHQSDVTLAHARQTKINHLDDVT